MTENGNATVRDGSSQGIPKGPPTVLVIDDLETVIEVFDAALEARGFRVLSALCGRDGLEKFSTNHVDLILCDLSMPHMDGWEVVKGVTEICRAQGRDKPPFLLVTAWATQLSQGEELREIGVDAVIGKPVRLDELLEEVAGALNVPGE